MSAFKLLYNILNNLNYKLCSFLKVYPQVTSDLYYTVATILHYLDSKKEHKM